MLGRNPWPEAIGEQNRMGVLSQEPVERAKGPSGWRMPLSASRQYVALFRGNTTKPGALAWCGVWENRTSCLGGYGGTAGWENHAQRMGARGNTAGPREGGILEPAREGTQENEIFS